MELLFLKKPFSHTLNCSFNNNIGPDIFHRLVPMEAHEASSLYSEEQAKLLRTIGNEIEESSNNLAVFMSALQLEDIPK